MDSFTVETVNRNDIMLADYNPRKISDDSRAKLKRFIKAHGIVQPPVVNRQTMRVVGGHQRLSILDEINKENDYELQVAFIDVSEEEEIKINIGLNNPSMQGEWDADLLSQIKLSFPEIDFIKDLGFDKLDLSYEFSKVDSVANMDDMFPEAKDKHVKADADKLRQIKLEDKHKRIDNNEKNNTYFTDTDDYMITIIVNNNVTKQNIMTALGRKPEEKFIKQIDLYKLQKLDLDELIESGKSR